MTKTKKYCCPEHCQEGFRRNYLESIKSKTKCCEVCGEEKTLIDFFHRGKPGRVYFRKRCSDCISKKIGKPRISSSIKIEGDTAYIQMIKKDKPTDEFAIIDASDVGLVMGRCWRLNAWGYPSLGSSDMLHRIIMGDTNGLEVDHINRNKLDSRRSNLRLATRDQNAKNRPIYKNNKSGIPGVRWKESTKRWVANIRINGKIASLGSFINMEDAKKARLEAEVKYYGEFAPR